MKTGLLITLLVVVGCVFADEDAQEKELHQRMGISEDAVHRIGEKKKLLEEIEEAKAAKESPGPNVETNEDPKHHQPSEADPHKEPEDVIEGDEQVTEDQIDEDLQKELVRRKRQFQTNPNKYWPTDLDYYIDPSFPSSLLPMLRTGIRWFNENTCFIFRQVKQKKDARTPFITYAKGSWCLSYVGRITGKEQIVQMSEACGAVGTIIHESLHALGFHHEQSRDDRDNHVRIAKQNIQKGLVYAFDKSDTDNFQWPYIFGSVMAYPGKAFSIDGRKQTIVANERKFQRTMGYRIGGTFADGRRVNTAYKCIDKCQSGPNCKNGGYRHPKWCNQCLCPEAFTGNDCSQLKRAVDPTGSNYGCGGVVQVPTTETRYSLSAKAGGQSKEHDCITQFKAKYGHVLQVRMAKESGDYMTCSGGCNYGFLELNAGVKNPSGGDRDYGLPGFRDCCVDQIDTAAINTDSDSVIATVMAKGSNAQLTLYVRSIRSGGGGGGTTVRPTTQRTTRRTTRPRTTGRTTTTERPRCRTSDQVQRVNKCLPYCNSHYSKGQSYEWYMKCYNDCYRVCA